MIVPGLIFVAIVINWKVSHGIQALFARPAKHKKVVLDARQQHGKVWQLTVVEKEYQALVVGDFASSSSSHVGNNSNNKTNNNIIITSGYIDLPLQRDHENFPFMRVATPASEVAAAQAIHDLQQAGYQKLLRKNPKPSQTQFQVVARYNMIVNSIHNEDDNDDDDDETGQ